jgi:hypothetical protein
MSRKDNGTFSVSHSEMQVYKDCKRRWFLQYYMRLVKKHQPFRIAPETGNAVHGALHHYYVLGGNNNPDAKAAAIEFVNTSKDAALAVDLVPEEIKDINETFKVADILVKGYFVWLEETGADNGWEVTGSEERLVVPGPLPDTEIKGYVDLLGTHTASGDMVVMDHKVTKNPDVMLKTLHLNEQAPLYAILMRLTEENAKRGLRVVWNMIKHNKQTKKAKPPFYQRYELVLSKDQLALFYAQLQGQIADMIETDRRLRDGEHHTMVAYPRPSDSCSWKCPYLALCGAMNDPRMDVNWLIDNNYEQYAESSVELTNKP